MRSYENEKCEDDHEAMRFRTIRVCETRGYDGIIAVSVSTSTIIHSLSSDLTRIGACYLVMKTMVNKNGRYGKISYINLRKSSEQS